jgi:squalene-associated FAD-dependent desaturase
MTRVAVIGGGWAGLAAAVRACQAGLAVELYEMAPQFGGRARSVPGEVEPPHDNGQHILIGAYRETLALMRTVGVDIDTALLRTPLHLPYPGEPGLRLPPGPALISFARGVLAHRTWPWSTRIALLGAATGWLLHGFRCDPALSVTALCARMPAVLRRDLIDPLCVAALNTPADRASASVFLRVLRDALFSGAGSADLLLPRQPLSSLLAQPAGRWLADRGAGLRLGHRVSEITRGTSGLEVDGTRFDAVIMACTSTEAARLSAATAPGWSRQAAGFSYEPIITVYLRQNGGSLGAPMLALRDGPASPAQFAFDHGLLGQAPGRSAWVVSGARDWVARGVDACAQAVRAQAQRELAWASPPEIERVLTEKRATFACTPGLSRPPMAIAPGLVAAGDYVAGPYPATLEGAVRSGFAAAEAVRAARPA